MAYVNPFTGGLLPGSTAPGIAISGTVDTFAALPTASTSNNGQYFIVNTTTATLGLFNKKLAGTYLSNGAVWNYVGALTLSSISDVNIVSPVAGHVLTYDSVNGGWVNSSSGAGLTNPMTTAGDLIIGGSSGTPTRLAAITGLVKGNGTTYQAAVAGTDYQDSLLVAEMIVGSGTSSGKTLYVGSGSAVTEINIANLDINVAGGYTIDVMAKDGSGVPATIYFFCDTGSGTVSTTQTDYNCIYTGWEGAIAGGSLNSPHAGAYGTANTQCSIIIDVLLLNSKVEYFAKSYRGNNTSQYYISGQRTATATNLTAIQLKGSNANTFAPGTIVRISKRK